MLRKLLFSNFKTVYKSSQLLRYHLTPLGILFLSVLIAAGVFGIDTRQSLAFQIFSLVFAFLIVSFIYSFFFKANIVLHRLLPEVATTGQTIEYFVLIKNIGNAPLHNLVIFDILQSDFPDFDDFQKTTDPDDIGRNWFDRFVGYPRLVNYMKKIRGGVIESSRIETLMPDEEYRVKIKLLPIRRGFIHFNHIKISRPDPFGLVYSVKTFPLFDSLLIYPKFYQLRPIRLIGSRKYQPDGISPANSVGDSVEFISLREYRSGDPLRDIHWRSFAKYKTPLVKEYHDEYCSRQGLILDTHLAHKPANIFEAAISVAASYTAAFETRETVLDLLFVGDKFYKFSSGMGKTSLNQFLEILSCIQPSDVDNFDKLKHQVLAHSRENNSFVCILLGMDKKRLQFIQQLKNIGVSVYVFHVVEKENEMLSTEHDPLKQAYIQTIESGNLQASLDKLLVQLPMS